MPAAKGQKKEVKKQQCSTCQYWQPITIEILGFQNQNEGLCVQLDQKLKSYNMTIYDGKTTWRMDNCPQWESLEFSRE